MNTVEKPRGIKFFTVIGTLIYVILFPFALYMGCFSLELLANPERAQALSIILVLLMFCIPISMPSSIYLMWRNFSRQKYTWTVFFGFLPCLTFGVVASLGQIVADFSRRAV